MSSNPFEKRLSNNSQIHDGSQLSGGNIQMPPLIPKKEFVNIPDTIDLPDQPISEKRPEVETIQYTMQQLVNKSDDGIVVWSDDPQPVPVQTAQLESIDNLVKNSSTDDLFDSDNNFKSHQYGDDITSPVNVNIPKQLIDDDDVYTSDDHLVQIDDSELPQINEDEVITQSISNNDDELPSQKDSIVSKESEDIVYFNPTILTDEVTDKESVNQIEEFEPSSNDSIQETESDDKIKLVAADNTVKNVANSYLPLIKEIAKKYDLESDEEAAAYEQEINNPNGLIHKLLVLANATNAARDLDEKSLQQHTAKQLSTIINDIRPKSASANLTANSNNPDKIISGKEARMFFIAKMRGAKRVFLMNSGFYIYVRPLTNLEISEFINTVGREDRDFGRTLGGHFYLFSSMHIKQFFASRLKSIVVDSNLQGYTQGDTLVDNISLQDYKTILWACACGMYKDGVKFTKICSFCGYEEEVLLNVDKLIFQNEPPILEKAYKHIEGKKNVTVKDVTAYRNDIVYVNDGIIELPEYKIELQVPTLTQYIKYATSFINTMAGEIRDNTDADEIRNYFRYTFYKQYAPWVRKISCFDINGNLQFAVNDEIGINEFFKYNSLEETTFGVQMEQYILDTMLTYIAFPYIECPGCHKAPEDIKNGLVAYDIETGFFTMSAMRLSDINSRIAD